jgi:putative oxidoreductase
MSRYGSPASASAAEDLGKLLLRILIGGLILLHGIAKLHGGVGPIQEMLAKLGAPEPVAYLVYVGELLAPAMLIAGIWTRVAALIVIVNMAVAVVLVHQHQLLQLTQQGGWALELQAMFLFGAMAIALLGAGRFSIGGAEGRGN